MLLSGHLLSQEPPSRKDTARRPQGRYHLQPSDWTFLTSGKPLPLWTPWASIFTLARSVLAAIPEKEAKPIHPAVISSRLRETLASRLPDLINSL